MTDTGDTLELTIDDIGFGGDGVAHGPEGMAIFVPFTAVGDRVRVTVMEKHRSFGRATVDEVLEPGPGRTQPPCPYYGTCGGCVYQHLQYDVEVATKKSQLADLLQRLGRLPEPPEPEKVSGSPEPYNYRNKIRLQPLVLDEAEDPGSRDVQYGYYQRDNVTVLPIESCPLASPSLNHMIARAPRTREGRRNAAARKPEPMTLRVTRDGSTAFYFGRAPKAMPWLHEVLLDKPVSVPAGSFWQVNPPVADQLVATVSEWFQASPTRTVIDGYSGVGTFALAIGEHAEHRFLIESDTQAMRAAEYNLEQWGGMRAHLRTGNTESVLPKLLAKSNLSRTTVLLDPPRQGCGGKAIQALRDFGPEQVIYVSCNASTLARDLRQLVARGPYQFRKLALFDMFPQTAHFETAVMLVRT